MDISEAARVYSIRSGINLFYQKKIRSGQYDGISRKDSNNPTLQKKDNHTAKYEADDDTFQDTKENLQNTRRVKIDIF